MTIDSFQGSDLKKITKSIDLENCECYIPIKSKTIYAQCTLTKKSNNSTLEQVSFIPVKFAKLGKVISIKKDHCWDNDWIISNIGSYLVEVEYDRTTYDWS